MRYSPIVRLMNPLLVLVLHSSMVLQQSLAIVIWAVQPKIWLFFLVPTPSTPDCAQNGPKWPKPKRTQAGDGGWASGCCGVPIACHARPIGHKASRIQTGVPRRGPGPFGAVFGPCVSPFWPHLPPPPPGGGTCGRGAEWGVIAEPQAGIWGGQPWGRPTSEFRAGVGADFFLWRACCWCWCCSLTCSYYGERGVVIPFGQIFAGQVHGARTASRVPLCVRRF